MICININCIDIHQKIYWHPFYYYRKSLSNFGWYPSMVSTSIAVHIIDFFQLLNRKLVILDQFCIDQAISNQYNNQKLINGTINSIDRDEPSCVILAVHLDRAVSVIRTERVWTQKYKFWYFLFNQPFFGLWYPQEPLMASTICLLVILIKFIHSNCKIGLHHLQIVSRNDTYIFIVVDHSIFL